MPKKTRRVNTPTFDREPFYMDIVFIKHTIYNFIKSNITGGELYDNNRFCGIFSVLILFVFY